MPIDFSGSMHCVQKAKALISLSLCCLHVDSAGFLCVAAHM